MSTEQYGFFHRLHKKYQRKLRDFTITIPMRLLDKKFTDSPLPPYSEIKSVLFIMDGSGIGDCVMHSIAMRELKKNIPNLKLDVVATARQHEFLAAYPYIDNIYMPTGASMLAYRKLGTSLEKNRYDIAFYQRNVFRLRELILLRMLKPRYLLSSNASMRMSIPLQIGNHKSYRYIDMLHKLHIDSNDYSYDIPSKPECEHAVEIFLDNIHISDHIAVNFWGSSKLNTFTEAKMADLIENILATYPDKQIILLSMPKKHIVSTLSRLCAKYPRTYTYDTSSIFESIALIRRAVLVVSTDTAIVHIASGLDKPTIAFYASKSKATNWAPTSTKHKVFVADFEVSKLDVRNIDLEL